MKTVSWDFPTPPPTNSTVIDDEGDMTAGEILSTIFGLIFMIILSVMVKFCSKSGCDGVCSCVSGVTNECCSLIGRCFGRIYDGICDLCGNVSSAMSTSISRTPTGSRSQPNVTQNEEDVNVHMTELVMNDGYINTNPASSASEAADSQSANDFLMPPPSYQSIVRDSGSFRDISLTDVVVTDPPPSYDEVVS